MLPSSLSNKWPLGSVFSPLGLAVFAIICLGASEVQAASCRQNPARWTDNYKGPKVTLPSQSDPTKVLVSWDRMITNQECMFSNTILIWRKDNGSSVSNSREVRKVEVIQLMSTSLLVDNIEPCTDMVFQLEFSDKEGFSLTKSLSGETTFKTEAQPSLINKDGRNIKVGYLYNNATSSHDLRTAVIKLDKDLYIKNPNCVKWIEVSGHQEAFNSLPSSPSKPPFDNRPTFPTPSSPGSSGAYNLRQRTKRTIGQLPRTTSTSSGSSSTYSRTSSQTSTTRTGDARSEYPALTDINQKLFPPFRSLNGVTEIPVTVQPCKTYAFSLDIKDSNSRSLGKIENIVLPPLNHIEGMVLPPIKSVLRLAETLTTIKIDMEPGSPVPPSCLIPYIDAVDARMKVLQALHLSGNRDNSPAACSRTPSPLPGGNPLSGGGTSSGSLSPVSDPKFLENSQKLRDSGCTCWNTTSLNVSSTDKTVLTKHIEVLGVYEFEGQMKNGKPQFVKKNGTSTMNIIWNNKTSEWWITDTLMVKPIMRTKSSKDLVCVSNNVAGKKLQFWERQSSLIGWSDDDTFNAMCIPGKTSPVGGSSSAGPKVSESEAIKQLKQHGCICQTSAQLNLSSTDSRTMKEHKDEMGLYTFEGQFYENHPYYTKKSSTTQDIYYLYWDKTEQTWFVSKQLGQKVPLLKMEANVGTKCPGDPTLKFWQRETMFGSWGTDENMSLKCHGNLLNTLTSGQASAAIGDDGKKKELLRQAGCKCSDSLRVNMTSTDSRTIRKHGDELGEYVFEGRIHEGKPYYTKKPRLLSSKTYYIFWEPESKTWWLGDQLGTRSPSMKMDDYTDLLCPADPPTKKSKAWMRKNVFGVWSDDDTTKVQCMLH